MQYSVILLYILLYTLFVRLYNIVNCKGTLFLIDEFKSFAQNRLEFLCMHKSIGKTSVSENCISFLHEFSNITFLEFYFQLYLRQFSFSSPVKFLRVTG